MLYKNFYLFSFISFLLSPVVSECGGQKRALDPKKMYSNKKQCVAPQYFPLAYLPLELVEKIAKYAKASPPSFIKTCETARSYLYLILRQEQTLSGKEKEIFNLINNNAQKNFYIMSVFEVEEDKFSVLKAALYKRFTFATYTKGDSDNRRIPIYKKGYTTKNNSLCDLQDVHAEQTYKKLERFKDILIEYAFKRLNLINDTTLTQSKKKIYEALYLKNLDPFFESLWFDIVLQQSNQIITISPYLSLLNKTAFENLIIAKMQPNQSNDNYELLFHLYHFKPFSYENAQVEHTSLKALYKKNNDKSNHETATPIDTIKYSFDEGTLQVAVKLDSNQKEIKIFDFYSKKLKKLEIKRELTTNRLPGEKINSFFRQLGVCKQLISY